MLGQKLRKSIKLTWRPGASKNDIERRCLIAMIGINKHLAPAKIDHMVRISLLIEGNPSLVVSQVPNQIVESGIQATSAPGFWVHQSNVTHTRAWPLDIRLR